MYSLWFKKNMRVMIVIYYFIWLKICMYLMLCYTTFKLRMLDICTSFKDCSLTFYEVKKLKRLHKFFPFFPLTLFPFSFSTNEYKPLNEHINLYICSGKKSLECFPNSIVDNKIKLISGIGKLLNWILSFQHFCRSCLTFVKTLKKFVCFI